MNYKWQAFAKFSQQGNFVFRTETILSTSKDIRLDKSHKHLFSIIMFNPGSSMPKDIGQNDIKTECNIDQTMGRIISWTETASKNIDLNNSFITIYNLFNLVNADIYEAQVQAELNSSSFIKELIDFNKYSAPQFIWKAWGKYPESNFFKLRVAEIEKIIRDSKIKSIGDNHSLLKNYHPSYLNRNKIRRELVIDLISESLI